MIQTKSIDALVSVFEALSQVSSGGKAFKDNIAELKKQSKSAGDSVKKLKAATKENLDAIDSLHSEAAEVAELVKKAAAAQKRADKSKLEAATDKAEARQLMSSVEARDTSVSCSRPRNDQPSRGAPAGPGARCPDRGPVSGWA